MKRTKIISKFLFYLTRGLAWIYLLTAFYGGFSWFTKTNIKTEQNQTIIHHPLTEKPFLILESDLTYVVFAFLIPVLGYVLFFWLLSNVFKVFYQQKLFTQDNIIHLKWFYLANVFLPLVLIIFYSC